MSKRDVPRNRDKRSKADLELFLLALIRAEVNTPYALHTAAGLSLGATVPALKRLEQAGYLRRGQPGTRGRTEFEITDSGKRYLKSGWRPLLECIPADMDAIIRTVSLAFLGAVNKKSIAAYLRRAAGTKTSESKRRRRDADDLSASATTLGHIEVHRWMSSTQASERLAAEAKVLRRFAKSILRR